MNVTIAHKDVYWIKNPVVLFHKNTIVEVVPTSKMSSIRKMNALARLVILLTIAGTLLTQRYSVAIIGVLTLIILGLIMDPTRFESMETMNGPAEGIDSYEVSKGNAQSNVGVTLMPAELENDKNSCMNKNERNPLQNRLIGDSSEPTTNNKITNEMIKKSLAENKDDLIIDYSGTDTLDVAWYNGRSFRAWNSVSKEINTPTPVKYREGNSMSIFRDMEYPYGINLGSKYGTLATQTLLSSE